MKRYVEFSIWNDIEKRPATLEEIMKCIYVKIVDEKNGKCGIVLAYGYSLLAEE